jgi:hypothetical protein
MKRTLLTTTLVVALAMPMCALEIVDFDALSVTRRTAYMNDLVDAAMRSLYRDEQYGDYTALRALFGYDTPGRARIPRGMIEFADNIDMARALAEKNPGRVVHVEDALTATLRNSGIEPPDDLMTLMSKPRG